MDRAYMSNVNEYDWKQWANCIHIDNFEILELY